MQSKLLRKPTVYKVKKTRTWKGFFWLGLIWNKGVELTPTLYIEVLSTESVENVTPLHPNWWCSTRFVLAVFPWCTILSRTLKGIWLQLLVPISSRVLPNKKIFIWGKGSPDLPALISLPQVSPLNAPKEPAGSEVTTQANVLQVKSAWQENKKELIAQFVSIKILQKSHLEKSFWNSDFKGHLMDTK